MHWIEFLGGVLIIISFLVAVCSFMLHVCHHFEFHREFKIAWCCCHDAGAYTNRRTIDLSVGGHIESPSDHSVLHAMHNWSKQVSQRTSFAAQILADEVKHNNCGCCHVVRSSNVNKDQLCCCIYSSVVGIEFYPLAVTLYFILLIAIIIFSSITLYLMYYKQYIASSPITEWISFPLHMHNIQQYCNVEDYLDDIQHAHFYSAPIPSIKQTDFRVYTGINYILLMFLLQWESLLNWYRFYSTRFMSLRFTKPPYLKIFGFFLIYTLVFVILCVAQLYIAFLLFPVIIIIHIVFNSYCISGFIKVLNNQYKHYVEASQGVSDLIITDLRDTMRKLKLCAIWCIISSSLFLLTVTLCRFGDMVLLCAPLWWIINCICWMFTFAKNALWFRHKSTDCLHICYKHCCCCDSSKANPALIRKTSKQLERERTLEIRRNSKNKILSSMNRPLSPINALPVLVQVANDEDEHTPNILPIITPAISETSHEMQLSTMLTDREPNNENVTINEEESLHEAEEKTEESTDANIIYQTTIERKETNTTVTTSLDAGLSSIKLPTILDHHEYSHSPNALSTLTDNEQLSEHKSRSKQSPLQTPLQTPLATQITDTPLSIIVTPAGMPPNTEIYRQNSTTYQYPEDYEDAEEEYFTFPTAHDLDVEVSISATSKKPKALDILGVNMDHEEPSRTKRTILNFMSSTMTHIEPQHVPCSSSDEIESTLPELPDFIDKKQSSGATYTKSPTNPMRRYYPRRMSGKRSSGHFRNRNSKTMSYEASQVLWGLIVGNGLVSSHTVQSLNQLEDYTIQASSPMMKPQAHPKKNNDTTK